MTHARRRHQHDYAEHPCPHCGEPVCHTCATGSRDNGEGGWEMRCPCCDNWFNPY